MFYKTLFYLTYYTKEQRAVWHKAKLCDTGESPSFFRERSDFDVISSVRVWFLVECEFQLSVQSTWSEQLIPELNNIQYTVSTSEHKLTTDLFPDEMNRTPLQQ